MPSILVVGAGVFGLGAAISLRKRGWDVTVFERYDLPSIYGSSYDTSRLIRLDYGDDEFWFRLGDRAIKTWREWNAEAAATGQPQLFYETGVLFLRKGLLDEPDSFEGDTLKVLEKHKHAVERFDCTAGGRKVHERFPAWTSKEYIESYHNPAGGWGNAQRTVEFMILKAQQLGIKFIAGERVGRFEGTIGGGAGDVGGIRTADGLEHRADRVLMACGPWTPSLVPELDGLITVVGHPLAYVKVPEEIAHKFHSDVFPGWAADISRTGWYGFPADPSTGNMLKLGVHGNGFVTRVRLPDGRECSVPVPGALPPASGLTQFRHFVDATFPELRDAPIVKTRLCYYCDTWDMYFYISAVPGRPNLFVATGGSGHAFKFTPVLGDIIADCVEGKANALAGDRFSWRTPPARNHTAAEPARKADGVPDEYHPTIAQLNALHSKL